MIKSGVDMVNRQKTLKRKIRILCYGDSNTWGFIPNSNHQRYDENTRWTRLLQKKLGKNYEVIEEGLCSRTLCSGRIDVEEESEKNGFLSLKSCMDANDEFDVFILALGINDFKRCFDNSIADICGFYEKYIEVLKNYRSKVSGKPIKFFILGIQRHATDNEVFDTVSRAVHVDAYMRMEHLDIYVKIPPRLNYLGDGIHYTEEGHRAIAELVYDRIKSYKLGMVKLVKNLPEDFQYFTYNVNIEDYPTSFSVLSKCADNICGRKTEDKNLIVIAGPNGSGKSTLIKQYIEFYKLGDYEYINSDIYARNLFSDTEDEKEKYLKAFEVEKTRKETAMNENRNFIMETVNSSDKNFGFYKRCKENGYKITVIFIATETSVINVRRVDKRVLQGGHGVPEDKIISRYDKSIENAKPLLSFADTVCVFDNSIDDLPPKLCYYDGDGYHYESEIFMCENLPSWVKGIVK